MLAKYVNLTIFSSKTPYDLNISTCNGQFIAKKKPISNPLSFCLCTTACCLKLIAKAQNETIIKTISLQNCRCQEYSVGFSFMPLIPTPAEQIFLLIDKNYNLPVKNAIINLELK